MSITDLTGKNVILLDKVDSTNEYLKKNSHLPDKTCVIARSQTAGRGRMGRKFFSPENSGLYLSILLKSKVDTNAITPLCAVAVSRAMEMFGIDSKIKWVNDIFVKNKKVCGILCESVFNGNLLTYTIVGIGVNLQRPQNGFDEEIADTAGYLFEDEVDLDKFAAAVINEFFAALNNDDFRQEYISRSFLIGKKVRFSDFSKEYEAEVKSINEDFSISLDNDGKILKFNSGEIKIVKF